LLWLCIHKLKGILRNRTVLMPTTWKRIISDF
jgi:hypothetical protein